jgi:hypothetical protein
VLLTSPSPLSKYIQLRSSTGDRLKAVTNVRSGKPMGNCLVRVAKAQGFVACSAILMSSGGFPFLFSATSKKERYLSVETDFLSCRLIEITHVEICMQACRVQVAGEID